jgi:hypothetical protein
MKEATSEGNDPKKIDGASGNWERRRCEQKNHGAGRGDGVALCWRNRGAERLKTLATYAATTD